MGHKWTYAIRLDAHILDVFRLRSNLTTLKVQFSTAISLQTEAPELSIQCILLLLQLLNPLGVLFQLRCIVTCRKVTLKLLQSTFLILHINKEMMELVGEALGRIKLGFVLGYAILQVGLERLEHYAWILYDSCTYNLTTGSILLLFNAIVFSTQTL